MEEIFGFDEITNTLSQLELVSKEKKSFLVDKEMAVKSSGLIKVILENDSDVLVIPFCEIKSNILELVILFMKYDGPERDNEIPKPIHPEKEMKDIVGEWRANFVDIEKDILFDLILAANYLNMDSLLHLTCSKVALFLRGKTVEQIKDELKL